ncbi:MAG: low specificity L-threonine aldolase [Rhizobiaceae bacterium]|nr:low specificity L-threonine aldolase [Rhizobiaceae bacterium]
MNFASDNWSGAAPEISKALNEHSTGFATAYGDSDLDRSVERKFAEIFECECAVFFVGTGTAANSMAATAVAKPGGVVFCHSEAHLLANEGGAPEFLTSGARMVPISGESGKISVDELTVKVAQYPNHFNHLGQGTLVSITQSTEAGTVYSVDEIGAIGEVAKAAGLPLHMDGARFANGLVKLGCSPADMTWKQGVDMVSFGGTKNGCWCAEALLVFDDSLIENFKFHRKKMGHLFSKTRFISAQFEAYLKDDLWLRLAQHSNVIGEKLEAAIRSSNRVRLAWPSESNQVFFIAKKSDAEDMLAQGANFYPFATPQSLEGQVLADEQVYRLVTAFNSTEDDVQTFKSLL